ncbi:MAG: hypothetical protein ACRD4Q_00115 [Candidatus Acidiferrales bacterium]
MSEFQLKQKISPRHAVVSSAGVRYYVRTVSGCARQLVVSLPREIQQAADLWKGRMVYIWVVNGVVMLKPLKTDAVPPEEA